MIYVYRNFEDIFIMMPDSFKNFCKQASLSAGPRWISGTGGTIHAKSGTKPLSLPVPFQAKTVHGCTLTRNAKKMTGPTLPPGSLLHVKTSQLFICRKNENSFHFHH